MNPRWMYPTEPQFDSEAALTGTETLQWLTDQGVSTFVRLPPGKKAPLYKDWNRRENAMAAHEIADAHMINVGLLCFDGVVVIDRDVAFPTSVRHMKSLAETVKVIRPNAPTRAPASSISSWANESGEMNIRIKITPRQIACGCPHSPD